MFRLINVHDHQRGLWFRRGELVDLILPGSVWLLSWQDSIQIINALPNPRFEHPYLEQMIEMPQFRDQLEVVKLDASQRAFVWKDQRLLAVLGAGLHAFWKTSAKLVVEVFPHSKTRIVLGDEDPSHHRRPRAKMPPSVTMN